MRQSLELNEAFYRRCIAPILAEHCLTLAEHHAAALIGWGSEVLGNDDEYSKRYGWGPRLVLFLPEDVYTTERHRLAQVLKEQVPLTFECYPLALQTQPRDRRSRSRARKAFCRSRSPPAAGS